MFTRGSILHGSIRPGNRMQKQTNNLGCEQRLRRQTQYRRRPFPARPVRTPRERGAHGCDAKQTSPTPRGRRHSRCHLPTYFLFLRARCVRPHRSGGGGYRGRTGAGVVICGVSPECNEEDRLGRGRNTQHEMGRTADVAPPRLLSAGATAPQSWFPSTACLSSRPGDFIGRGVANLSGDEVTIRVRGLSWREGEGKWWLGKQLTERWERREEKDDEKERCASAYIQALDGYALLVGRRAMGREVRHCTVFLYFSLLRRQPHTMHRTPKPGIDSAQRMQSSPPVLPRGQFDASET